MIQFEWDKNKNHSNIKKHKLSFETAIHVFDDPHMLNWPDPFSQEYGEERWIGLGAIGSEIIIVIIHTIKVYNYDEETIRIISARKANSKEKKQYLSYYKKNKERT